MPRMTPKSSVSDQTPKRSRAATGTPGSESSPGPSKKHPTKSSPQNRQKRQRISQDPVDELGHPRLMDTNPPMSPQRGAADGDNLEPVIVDSQLPDSQLPDPQLSSLKHAEDPPLKLSQADNPTSIVTDNHPLDTQSLDTQPVDTQLVNTQLVNTQPVNTQPVNTQLEDAQLEDAQLEDTQLKCAQLEDARPVNTQLVDAQPVDAQPVDAQPVNAQPEHGKRDSLNPVVAKAQLPDSQQPSQNNSVLDSFFGRRPKAGDFETPFPSDEQNKRWTNSLIFDGHAGDNLVGDTWLPLTYDVSRFINLCLPRRASWDSLDAQIQGKVKRWAGNKGKHYIEAKGIAGSGPDTLCTAWIWRILYDNLFSPDCTDKWFGENWAAHGKLRLALREHINHADNTFSRTYHGWRYSSARMLYALYGSHSDPERLKGILKEELGQLIQMRGTDPTKVDESLEKLVTAAIEIDLQVEVSKDNIWFEMHDPETQKLSGFIHKEDSATVEARSSFRNFDKPSGRPVDFIECPAIWKYGEARSTAVHSSVLNYRSELFHHNYGQGSAMVKMKVVVDQFPDQKDEQDVGVEEGEKEGGAEA